MRRHAPLGRLCAFGFVRLASHTARGLDGDAGAMAIVEVRFTVDRARHVPRLAPEERDETMGEQGHG